MNAIDGLFESLNAGSDFMTPAQFADGHRKDGECMPERKMWAAAFSMAIEDWRRSHCDVRPAGMNNLAAATQGRCVRMKAELAAWFSSDEECPLSFLWYATMLGLDATAVRARLLTLEVLPARRRGDLNKVRPRANVERVH